MTLASSDTPLRRSEVARVNKTLALNDDEAERREERRLSVLRMSTNNNISESATTIEDNETLQKCLDLCLNGNKLSRENAWSLSLIDALSSLLDRHHKSLNNFKMAGSSLEASSKVYGLRVDSIHIDVLRMAAGLNAKKFSEKNLDLDLDDDDDDDGVATAGEGNADPNASAAGLEENAASQKSPGKKKKTQRQRKAVCTITKNKETLNARLDSVPLQDSVFGKLNSTVGSINSSNRLMSNVLLTTDSELRLRTNFPVFDANALPECDYTVDIEPSMLEEQNLLMVPSDKILRLYAYCEHLQLRPLHAGYIISDAPDDIPDDLDAPPKQAPDDAADNDDFNTDHNQSMAFDINAECEPVPQCQEYAAIVDVDYAEFDDLTTEERSAINRCRGMRKEQVLIEDLRPVDSTSQLEYSYRPMDKISRFWAGPAHWKFKRTRPSSFAAGYDAENGAGRSVRNSGATRQRSQAAAALLAKKRQKQLDFSEVHDDLFLKLDENFKRRRVNIQKKWDNRKLKLPTDMRLDSRLFFQYKFAPGLRVAMDATVEEAHERNEFDDDVVDDGMSSAHDNDLGAADDVGMDIDMPASDMPMDVNNGCNNDVIDNEFANSTVLEIPTEFANAPTMVQKIVVPFAKRAKVVDMKTLKKCCSALISKQLQCSVEINTIPQHTQRHKQEQYIEGVASFQETLEHLPELLSQTMANSLSPAIAVYSVLHLANDLGLRLIQQDDLEDFKVRRIAT